MTLTLMLSIENKTTENSGGHKSYFVILLIWTTFKLITELRSSEQKEGQAIIRIHFPYFHFIYSCHINLRGQTRI